MSDVESRRQHIFRALTKAAEDFGIHPCDPCRGIAQTVASRILPGRQEQFTYSCLRALEVKRRHVFGIDVCGTDGVRHSIQPRQRPTPTAVRYAQSAEIDPMNPDPGSRISE